MARYTPAAKLRLSLGIQVLQKYGKPGTIIADRLLKETPPDSPAFSEAEFWAKLDRKLKNKNPGPS